MGSLGWTEIAIIFLAVLILFGAKKIPELAKGLGQGLREFRRATQEVQREFENVDDTIDKANAAEAQAAKTEEEGKAEKEPAG